MTITTTDNTTHGLTADEERHLACECLRLGSWPRSVTLARTGTVYEINNRRVAKRLLRLLGIGEDNNNGNTKES